jgi:hypothetical protein
MNTDHQANLPLPVFPARFGLVSSYTAIILLPPPERLHTIV